MNNFTPEYIELCKSSKVQELRPKIQNYDFACDIKRNRLNRIVVDFEEDLEDFVNSVREKYIFLPNGDWLDEEIVKICKKNDLLYRVDCESNYLWETKCEVFSYGENEMVSEANHLNPLIAKISLLIQLLEGE